MFNTTPCALDSTCSGCDLRPLGYSQQKAQKLQTFQKASGFQDVEFISFGEQGLRSRFDYSIQNGRMGLYKKNSREIQDIQVCLQLEPRLQEFYSEFRKLTFPVEKGSVRLRVSPSGLKGAWLDFANVDVKKLLDEKTTLLALRDLGAVVEMGQRHKSLIQKKDGSWGLGDPVFHPWFQSWKADQPVELFGTIASFTQPSHVSNQQITQKLSKWFLEKKPDSVLEFGSGSGNLTFPALSSPNTQVTCVDWDGLALQALKMNLEKSGDQDRVEIFAGDFRQKSAPRLNSLDVLLLNPARSGLGKFLDTLLPLKPKHIVYMSCYQDSFLLDTQNLRADYSPAQVMLLDQFPQTHHVEILSFWERR